VLKVSQSVAPFFPQILANFESTLFGTKLNNAYLALGILSTAFAGAYVSTRGDKTQAKPINVEQAKASVPVQAGSSCVNTSSFTILD